MTAILENTADVPPNPTSPGRAARTSRASARAASSASGSSGHTGAVVSIDRAGSIVLILAVSAIGLRPDPRLVEVQLPADAAA